ncbi:MAG: MBL fold metallo-hydrolase, partial [Brevinema sp.]
MHCASLISGSKANSFYVETEHHSLLIDAGLSLPKLESAFAKLRLDHRKICGILITHEHEDHIRHLKRIAHALKLPVYITEESLKKSGLSLQDYHIIKAGDEFCFGDIHVDTFQVLHDAEMCLGFVFHHQGKKLFFASDIGSFDQRILNKAENADFIGIEANYEPSMLAQCLYPQHLKERISSGSGHLSNPQASRFIKESMGTHTKNVMFLHISENSNCTSHIEKMIDRDLHHMAPEIHFRITNRHTNG